METMTNATSIMSNEERTSAKNEARQLISGYALESINSIQFPIESPKLCGSDTTTSVSAQLALSRIYQVFSHRFPSPQVVKKIQEQNARQAQTATNATLRPYRNIFSRLFGQSPQNVSCIADETNRTVSEHVEETDEQESDNAAAAADNERNVLDLDDTDSFDENMIPPEAHHCARLYLSSIKSRVYASSNSCLSEKYKVCKNEFIDQRSVCAIVGLGRVVEIPIMSPRPMETHNGDDEESNVHKQAMIFETNDREALLEAQEYFANPQSPMVPCVDLVRCAQLSENCIAVSWGMDDGIVVIYRRVKFDDGRFGWHSIAMVSPQEDVIDSVENACTMARIVGSSQLDRRKLIYESGLLRVSEMIPLHLAPHCQVENHTILVVGRLGGYLEFITIPNEVCQGPLIRPRQKKLRGCGHYASRLPNISEDRRLNHGWLSTREVQLDITSLAIIKTNESITNSSHMDNLSMEYMICTSGMSTTSLFENAKGCESPQTRVGCECLALWRFSMEPGGNDKKYSMQFNLLDHSQLPQVGPDVSIFASKGTISNWVPNAKGCCPIPITIAPPISDIQMSSSSTSNSVFISILHYNGLSTSLNYVRDSSMSTFDNTKGCCRLRVLREKEESLNQLMQNHDSIVTTGWWCTENTLYLIQGTSKGYLMLKQVCDSNSDVIDFSIITSMRHPISNTSIITKSFPQTQTTIVGCEATKNEGLLTLYRVGHLCLTNYIHSLVSQENLEEASELAKFGNLTVANVPVVEKLRIHLWEKRFDVESFKMISDDKYVIQQAYSLDELVRQKSSIGTDVMHDILEEALLRINAVESKNSLFDQTVKTKIINDLTYLGTYIRLSQLLDLKNVSASRFIEKFLPIDVMSLAKAFAAHGDIRSVCLIVSRHSQFWESVTIMIEVLNCLPLSIPIRDFEMLLPDTINTSRDQWWSKVTDFAENYLLIQIFDGILEKRNIEAAICNNDQHCFRDDFNLIAWYLKRAKSMASSFGLLELTVLFLNKAIETIGEETVDERSQNIILDIISLRACLYHMHSIVELGMCLDTVLVQRMQAMSVHEFESLGVSGAIELILGSCKDEQEFTFRYKEILHPMFSLDDLGPDYVMRCWPDLVTGEPCYNFDRKKELELGMVLFCLNNLQHSIENDAFNNNGSTRSQLTALTLCEVLVKCSSTKIPVQERIIGDTLILMQFVLDVAKTIGVNLCSYHIEVLWRLYECIPAFCSSMTDDDGWKCLSQSIDSLYRTLLGLDLCQRWLDKHKSWPVSLDELYDGHQMWSIEANLQSSTFALARFGSKLINSMCEGFIKKCKELSDADMNILFLSFMSDVYDLNDYCCHGMLHVEDAFSMHLVHPLLEAHSFEMLRKFLLTGCVSKRLFCTAIETFAKDLTLISDDDRVLHLISMCRYYLGDISPECSSTLKALQNAFVSLAFLKNNTYGSRSTLSSLDVKRSPISSIVYVLENEPHMITVQDPDCAESWFSSSAITEVLNKFKNAKNDSYLDDLSFPSFAVLKFANNLGLRDPRSQFIVKGLIAKFACYHGMHAIALAICTIILFNVVAAERTCSRVDVTAEEFLLKHISSATSLSCLTHPDIIKDLCRRTICWWNPKRCRADTIDHFINILRLCSLAKIEREEQYIYEIPGFEATEKVLTTIISIMNQVDRHSISLVSISDMHTKDVMDRILAWSAGSWFSMNKDKRHQKFTVLELWLYMVFVLNLVDVGPETSLSYCLQEIERSEKSAIDSMSYEKPSKTIVDKLVHLGYTANAAQRASINTDNQNASAALLWAVAHANDPDFNDPLPILKKQTDSSDDRYLLQENLILPKQMIHNALNYITKFKLTNRDCDQSTVKICGKDPQNDKCKSLSLFDKHIPISTNVTNGHSTMTVQNRTSLNSGSFDERKQGNGGRQLLLERGNISLLAAEGRKLLERAKEKSSLVPSTLKGTEKIQKGIKQEHTSVAEETALIKGEQKKIDAERLRKQAEEKGKQQRQRRETEEAETIREKADEKQKRAAQEAERLRKKAEEEGTDRLRKLLQEQKRVAQEDARIKREEDEEAERLRWQLEEQEKHAAEGLERLRKQAKEEQKYAAEETERLQKQAEEEEAEKLRKQAEEEQKRVAQEAEKLHMQAEEEEAERLLMQAEEEQKRVAQEAERLRKKDEEEEAQRLRMQAEEEQKRAAQEAERLRKTAEKEEAERLHMQAELENVERLRKLAEEEQKRVAQEAERILKQAEEEEAERLRKQAEEEQKRIAQEAERIRVQAEEEEVKRLCKQAEEEQKRAAQEAERLRMQAEEEEVERLHMQAELEKVERLRKLAEEEQKRAAQETERLRKQAEEEEAERLRKEAEEEQKRAVEEAERLCKQAEEEKAEKLRKQAEEEQKRAAEEAERLRKQAEEEEVERLHKILEEEQKLAAEEAERLRKQTEEEVEERLRKQAEEEEAEELRKILEEEQKCAAEEAERLRKQAEEEQAERLRIQAEEEQKREAKEAERLRMQAEEEEAERLRKQAEEEEQKRVAEQTERLRKQAEEEEAERLRKQAEDEQKRVAEQTERLRKRAEEEEAEKLRKQAEEEEAERLRKILEEEQKLAAEEAERLRKQTEEEVEERLLKQAEEEEAEELRKILEEEQKLAAEEAERLQKQAEEEQAERLRIQAEEEQKREAKEAERLRMQAEEEEAERLRKQAEEEEQKRVAEQTERLRKRAEEEEAERLRKIHEVEQKRAAQEAERLLKQAEEEEAEELRKILEEEQKLAAEEAERLQKQAEEEEADKHRKILEEEEKCAAQEAERLRKQAEEEQKRIAEEAERLRKQAEEEEAERLRKQAEEEEAERLRIQAEEEQKRAIEKAARIKRKEEEEPERKCKVVEVEQKRAQSLNCTLEQKELMSESNGDEICSGEDKDGCFFDQDSIDVHSSISLSSPFKPSSSVPENTSRAPYVTSSSHVVASSDLLHTCSNDIPRSDLDDSDNEGWEFDF